MISPAPFPPAQDVAQGMGAGLWFGAMAAIWACVSVPPAAFYLMGGEGGEALLALALHPG